MAPRARTNLTRLVSPSEPCARGKPRGSKTWSFGYSSSPLRTCEERSRDARRARCGRRIRHCSGVKQSNGGGRTVEQRCHQCGGSDFPAAGQTGRGDSRIGSCQSNTRSRADAVTSRRSYNLSMRNGRCTVVGPCRTAATRLRCLTEHPSAGTADRLIGDDDTTRPAHMGRLTCAFERPAQIA